MSMEKLLFPLLLGLTAAVCYVVALVGCMGIRLVVSGDDFFTSGVQDTMLATCHAFWASNLCLILIYFP